MAKPKGSHYVVSAAFTESGAPAYWATSETWSANLQDAAALETAEQRDRVLAEAAKQEAVVCDPYSFMVRLRGDVIEPLSVRETVRANGPTVPVRRPDPEAPSTTTGHRA